MCLQVSCMAPTELGQLREADGKEGLVDKKAAVNGVHA